MTKVCEMCLTEVQDSHIGTYCPNKDCDELDGADLEQVPKALKKYAFGRYISSGKTGDRFIEYGGYSFKNPWFGRPRTTYRNLKQVAINRANRE